MASRTRRTTTKQHETETTNKRKSRRRKSRRRNPCDTASKSLTKEEQRKIDREKARLVTWMKELNDNKDSFSRDWTLYVLTELTLQCMGKLPIMKEETPITIFNPKAAERAVRLGAAVSGALMDGQRGGSNGSGPLPKQIGDSKRVDEPVITEPKSDEERTREVYELLMQHGGVPKLKDKAEENKVIEIKAG